MLTDAELSDLRKSLEEEKAALQQQLGDLALDDGRRLSFDQNFADSSQVTAERGEFEAVSGSLQASLDEVNEALAKFDKGTYGLCERCGNAIAPARLEAKPAARLCIDCANRR
ncbi:MAG: TraR/DksA family transcriptional regulator [Actinomycetota bacterium]|nr:TraR/DksA family transcriptional regulator [Actinomycetota bacterium]